MNEGEKILWNAMNRIAWGSNDDNPPFRAAPREVLIELARKAIDEYRNLTSRSSRAAGTEAELKIDGYKQPFGVLTKGRSKSPPA